MFKWARVLILFLGGLIFSIDLHADNKVSYGFSSWYGRAFHGKKTASGEVFNMYKKTAAHRTIPFGTYLKVTNVKNKKSTVVRVNDRGPFKPNRILDVSRRVSQILGFEKQGIALVRIDILGKIDQNNKVITENLLESERIEEGVNNSEPYEFLMEGDGLGGGIEGREKGFSEKEEKDYISSSKEKEDGSYFLNPPNLTPEIMGLPMRMSKILILNIEELEKGLDREVVFKIQFGAYKNIKLAIHQYRVYKKKGIPTLICLLDGETDIFRILSRKSFRKKQDAEIVKDRLVRMGLKSFVVKF